MIERVRQLRLRNGAKEQQTESGSTSNGNITFLQLSAPAKKKASPSIHVPTSASSSSKSVQQSSGCAQAAQVKRAQQWKQRRAAVESGLQALSYQMRRQIHIHQWIARTRVGTILLKAQRMLSKGVSRALLILRRLLQRKSTKFMVDEAMEGQIAKRRRLHRLLLRGLAILGQRRRRAQQSLLYQQHCSTMARQLATEWTATSFKATAHQVARERYWSHVHQTVARIQRFWRRCQRHAERERSLKHQLHAFLSSTIPKLIDQQEQEQRQRTSRTKTANTVYRHVLQGAAKRIAVRTIQRLWRGHRARTHYRRIRAHKQRQRQRQTQRERLSRARSVLLAPNAQAQARERALHLRIQSRQQRAPLLSATMLSPTPHLQTRRTSLLAPLQTVQAPRSSSLTKARTQRVPFTRFERICERRARVNPHNLWVAIPVAHTIDNAPTPLPAPQQRCNTLAPLTPTSPTTGIHRRLRPRPKAVHTTYDWIPATLLRHALEHHGPHDLTARPSST